jgi:hypothetical protein
VLARARPSRGIDGATYHPGRSTGLSPVVAVRTRAMSEVIRGWTTRDEMLAWIAGRTGTAPGSLRTPPAAAASRTIREEHVLARLLSEPAELPDLAGHLTPDMFASDVRYDLYAAILAAAGQGGDWITSVATELDRRIAWLPGSALPAYGGPGAPWARTCLQRLAATPVTHGQALDAQHALRRDDLRAVLRAPDPLPAWPLPRHLPEVTDWIRRTSPPPTAWPPGPGGPQPRI